MSAIQTESSDFAPAWWDVVVATSPLATVFQSSAWARFAQTRHGVRFVWALEAREAPLGLLLLEALGGRGRSFRALVAGGSGQYAWRSGPLVLRGDPAEVVGALLDQVDRDARVDRILTVRGTTPIAFDGGAALDDVFGGRGYGAQPAATLVVDLGQSLEELWRAFDPSVRKAVGRCERQGVTVRRLGPDDSLAAYQDLLRQTRARLGLDMPPYYPTDAMREAFRTTGAACEVFVAVEKGTPIAGMGVLGFGATAIEVAIAQGAHAVENKIYTGELIKWAVLRWAKEAGFRWYDLGGIELEPADAKAAGIRRFKEKFGGRLAEYVRYERARPRDDGVLRRLGHAVGMLR